MRYYRISITGVRKTFRVMASDRQEAMGSVLLQYGIPPEYICGIEPDLAAQAEYERHKVRKRFFGRLVKRYL
jgi:hypothetical protein